jgi:transcriptional regulator with XRE-family HTH domain
MDHEDLSRELVRTLRGKHSQPWLCRRLGLRSNLVYRWEAGRAFPSAQQFFRICRVTHARGSLELDRFLGSPFAGDLETKAGVVALLTMLAGTMKVQQLAATVGRSRFIVSRWLAGSTQIRLPDLLHFIEATTRRLLDFCAVYVDPSTIERASRDWRRLQATRTAAYEVPWSHGVLRALELADYARVAGSSEAWLSRRLGIPREEIVRALSLLCQSGQVGRRGGRYVIKHSELIDTGVDRERRQGLRSFWTRVALERLEQGAAGIHAFNLFSIAERDIPELHALHAEFFEKLRSLVARSSPAERVLLYSAQMLRIDGTSA